MRKEKGKDPAFLLYAKDWLTGTFFMTYDQKGRFIDLLCHQHLEGGLTLDDIMKILEGVEDEKLLCKFEELDGKFFNRKLKRVEKEREDYAKIQSENGKKGGRPKANNNPIDKPNENPRVEEEEEDEVSNHTIETNTPNHLFKQQDNSGQSLDDLYKEIETI